MQAACLGLAQSVYGHMALLRATYRAYLHRQHPAATWSPGPPGASSDEDRQGRRPPGHKDRTTLCAGDAAPAEGRQTGAHRPTLLLMQTGGSDRGDNDGSASTLTITTDKAAALARLASPIPLARGRQCPAHSTRAAPCRPRQDLPGLRTAGDPTLRGYARTRAGRGDQGGYHQVRRL